MIPTRWPLLKGESYGNCRAYGKVEKRTACFPTFPHLLGKLVAKKPRRVFHSSHSFYYWSYCLRRSRKNVTFLMS